MRTLVDLLRAHCDSAPDRRAFVFLSRGAETATLSYGELARRVLATAAELRAAHGRPGGEPPRALVLCASGPEFLIAYLACLASGTVAVPTPLPTASLAGNRLERLKDVADDCAPSLLLVQPDLAPALEAVRGQSAALDGCAAVVVDVTAEVTGSLDELRWPEPDPDEPAVLQYTSGSTFRPKGVRLSQRNLLANATAVKAAFGAGPDSVVVSWLPTSHGVELMTGVLLPLRAGCLGVLMPPVDFARKPSRWLSAISRYRGTISGAPGSAFDLCRHSVSWQDLVDLDLSSWEVAFCAAEPVSMATLDGFADELGPHGLRREALIVAYGLAESTALCTAQERLSGPRALTVDLEALGEGRVRPAAHDAANAKELVDAGVPAESTTVRVVNPETGSECADGEVGEVWIAGPSVAEGYWNRPCAGDGVFSGSLAGSDLRFLRTGDLGVLLDDHLYLTGRTEDLIVIGGRSTCPQDVEMTAEWSSPALRTGASAAFSGRDTGEGLVVVAEVDERTGPEDLPEVADRIRAAVAQQQEVPVGRVALIRPRSIPKTSIGEVQRRECRAALLEGRLPVVFDWPGDQAAGGAGVRGGAPVPRGGSGPERGFPGRPTVSPPSGMGGLIVVPRSGKRDGSLTES